MPNEIVLAADLETIFAAAEWPADEEVLELAKRIEEVAE